MPLAPAARTLIDQLESGGGPALWEMSPDDARALSAVMGAMDDPPEVAAVEDRVIAGPAGDVPVRIYTPDAPAPRPVVAFFHGGGFVICSVETHDGLARRLANALGAVLVSVEYRLAPEHPFPIPLDDCDAAISWVAAHAVEIGAEPGMLAVMGDSAGGNLAAAATLVARDRKRPHLAAQVLVYPALDPARDTPSYRENGAGYLLDDPGMEWFWQQYLQDDEHEKNPLAAPARADDLRGLPPATVITAEFDPLRDEGEAYATRLSESGVAARTHRVPGMLHGFLGMPAMFDEANDAMGIAARALREAFDTAR